MYRLIVSLLFYLFPTLLMAEGNALTFAPPPSDYSVVFLGNLFGIVDGVLHGTSGQIMGSMFMVFNSAVLALGGIVIMYTLIVSTMNTAHEGQMLGQKWSSIWIPVRSTLGLALLIPKASGYCLMQIFFMWVVIQGVGAADKVWDAALSYLNRGGSIIQTQPIDPTQVLLNPAASGVAMGAGKILAAQVCMLGLQKQLVAQRQSWLNASKGDSGYCSTDALKKFCTTQVPDFLNTVNAVEMQNANLTSSSMFELPMPNIDMPGSPYYFLNGICGVLTWNSLSNVSNLDKSQGSGFTADEFKTAQLSRAIAIQQMYVELSALARVIVNNDPQLGMVDGETKPNTDNFSPVAVEQFGVPQTNSGEQCDDYGKNCMRWGSSKSSSGVLFNGTEFQGAINDYNAIMKPTLNALSKASQTDTQDNSRDFITKASAKGWIMAGSYFFDLIKLNSRANDNVPASDSNTGLEQKPFSTGGLINVKDRPTLAVWFPKDDLTSKYPRLEQVKALLDGSGLSASPLGFPDLKPSANRALIDRENILLTSTVYGFINNSLMVQLAGQPGIAPMQFANVMSITTSGKPYADVPSIDFPCGEVSFFFFSVCLGEILGDIFYNGILRGLINIIANIVYLAFQALLNVVLWLPLQAIGLIFKSGVQIISKPGANPIVALADMGVMYINFAGNLWITLMMAMFPAAFPISIFVMLPLFAMLMLALPLIIAWVGIMVTISFVTAYYVPILPYMMFVFGAIGWITSVIEAMVAAPLVALGITHPEGHDALGKGEQALMILMNVFLRPSMMIIGYVAAIALTYVSVWILNAGFDNAISYMQGGPGQQASFAISWGGEYGQGSGSGQTQYTGWAGLFAFFFSILTYTTLYLIVVQKSFGLISFLPDKVLRWIGGSPESIGQEAAQWGEEAKSGTKEAGTATYGAAEQIGKSAGAGTKQVGAAAWKRMNKPKMDVSAIPEASPEKKE